MNLSIRILRLPSSQGLPFPEYQTAESAGCDLIAALPAGKDILLQPRERALVPTGLCLEIPPGYEAQVRPRSGLALKHGVTVLNAPGTIDSDYRGEVCVMLVNHGEETFTVARGMRVAQIIFAPVSRVTFIVAEQLTNSVRGTGGFGSTGAHVASAQALKGSNS